ncbi:MAG: YoaP domain-containing protein [Phycisphaerales bacterium]|nr:MAG: YoaP domain-containing protein [Phycisphaerales bacterium]
MAEGLKAVNVTQDNFCGLPCCGIKDTENEGHERKSKWLKTYFKRDLQARVLLAEKNVQCGYIEYLPGQYAWREVEADDYMFIHCIWTFFKKSQRKGYGRLLIQACVDDAKRAKMKGVAVLARKRPWLAGSSIFLRNGFEIVGRVPPDYELLVRRLSKTAPNPRFKDRWDQRLKKYGKGLTIIRANQCPHTIRFGDRIAEVVERVYGLKPRIVELKTYQQAQNAPTRYAVFAVIYDGQLLADHQISAERFKNIMNEIL